MTVPRAHIDEINANHLPRSRRGTMSQAIISVRAIIPPPPMPCTERPTRMTVKFFATAAIIAPAPNRARETYTRGLRPKMWEKLPMIGWNTVLVRRKLVPDQKASIAVPPSVFAMMGRATDSEVASRATMSVMTERELKATMKRHPGLNADTFEVNSEDFWDEGLEPRGTSPVVVSFSRCTSAGRLGELDIS